MILFLLIVIVSYGDESVEKFLGSIPLISAIPEGSFATKEATELKTNDSAQPISGLFVPCTGCTEPYSVGTGPCQDYDGDGVANKCDIDDDNDGVPDKTECPGAFSNLVAGGGFTTDPPTQNWYFANSASNYDTPFSGFPFGYGTTQTNSTNTGGLFDQVDGNNTNTGTLNALIEVNGATDALVTRLNEPVVAGVTYNFSFDAGLRGASGAPSQSARVFLYNADANTVVATLVSEPLTNLTAYPTYRTLTGTYTATTSGNYYLLFMNAGDGGAGNDYIIDRVAFAGDPYGNAGICDVDQDGIPNHLDYDSDGDGCSDSFEAGAIPSEVSDHKFSSSPDVNGNGLNDNIESGTTGQTNYSSTYNPYALSNSIRLCADSDNDGVNDVSDIDIDNDGVINSIESPSCFYSAQELESGNRGSFVKITTGLNMVSTYSAPNELVDGDAGTGATSYAVQFANAQTITSGSNIYTFEFLMPVKLKNIYLGYATTNSHFGASTVIKLQGSIDGTTWTDLNSGTSYGTTNSSGTVLNQGNIRYNQFTVASGSEARYRFYRIAGVSGTTSSNGLSNEIYFEVASDYVASLNPKPSCSEDPDGDGIPNHYDLDSDGDTCPDVYESSVPGATKGTGSYTDNVVVDPATPTAGVGTNGYKNTLETATDSNIPNFSPTYFYSTANALNKCADTDNDGIVDLEDIDMDNDGIVNAAESPDCFYTVVEMAVPQNVTTQIPTTGTVSNVYDNVAGTTFAFTSTTAANALGKSIFEVTPKYPQAATAIILNLNTATSPIGALSSSATLRAEGWNGSAWVALATFTASPTVSSNVQTFAFASNTTEYLKYRLFESGTNGVAIGTNAIQEVKVRMPTGYVPSANPKPGCSQDTDGDTVYNHLDLDSDGDGCPDLTEAGVSPGTDVTDAPATNNSGGSWGIDDPAGAQLNPAGTDANDDGLNDSVDTGTDGQTDYISTYGYAVDGNTNACLDSDGDGIKDIADIDDDNDGVLDELEMFCNNPESPKPTITAVNGTVVDNNELNYWESAQNVVIDFPYSFEKFNALFWSVDTGDNFTVTVRLEDGTLVGPIDGRLFSSTSDPSWVNRWTIKGYPMASSDVNWAEPLGEYSGAPFNPGEVFYTSTYPNNLRKSWGAVEFSVPQATRANGIDQIVFNIKPGIGATAFVEIEPLNILSSCRDLDTDNDGIPNRLDLDSDGDGCSDLTEAGVSPGTDVTAAAATNNEGESWGIENPEGAQLNTEGTDANNDGLNDSVDTGQDGQTDYASTYTSYALSDNLNACADTDGDGIPDLEDIDVDNDGIANADESPNCYYSISEFESGDRDDFISVSTGLNMHATYNAPLELVDGDAGTAASSYAVGFINSQPNAGSNIYTFKFLVPVELKNIYLRYVNGNSHFINGAVAKLQGSSDGNTWTDLNAGATYNQTNTSGAVINQGTINYHLFPVTQNSARYNYYRIAGVSGTIWSSGYSNEVYFEVASDFIPSLNPKPGCSEDTDGDGIYNHQDLDSDGDGCSDLTEAGVSPGTDVTAAAATTNEGESWGIENLEGAQLNTEGTDANNDGLNDSVDAGQDGQTDYNSTYSQYALAPSLNFCEDTDNDGRPDVEDIDDDNDGVFDIIEQTCTASNIASAASKNSIVVTKPSTINYTFNGAQTLPNLVDGTDANTLVMYNPTGTLSNSEWFRVEFPLPRTLTSWEVAHYSGQTLFSLTSTYKVQGSNDGTTWSDLTGTLTYSRTQPGQSTQANNSNVAQFPNNKTAYKFYRYFGVSGAVGTGWATEFFFVERNCTDLDTDNDGVPNRLDLDSDGDRCPDANEAGVISFIEGLSGAVYSRGNVVNSDLSFEHPEAVAGPGPSNPAAYGANGFYNSIESNDLGTATYSNTGGYTYGNALDPSIASCICYEVPVTEGTALIPLHGTTTLNRAGATMNPSQWLNPRTGAHLVLESKTKGFVITRIASPETAITAPVPGMIVYDTDDNCIKIYVDGTDGWQCFSVQTCND